MPLKIYRIRGMRRKKIESAIREAGFIRTYSTNSYSKNLRVKQEPSLDLMRLADEMGRDDIKEKRSLCKDIREFGGIKMAIAKEIIEFININYNSNLKIKFDDYS